MKYFVLIFIGLVCISRGGLGAVEEKGVRKVEERSRYEIEQDGVQLEAIVIRWHLDHEMNSTALLRYASFEVAEQRGQGLFGKYRIEQSSDDEARYLASVFTQDSETGRFATAMIRGVTRGVVTIRVVSWGIKEEEHRRRAAELISRFEERREPIQSAQPTSGS